MLNRLVRRRAVVCPPLLLSFFCAVVWMPVGVVAEPVQGRGPSIVLVIPPQKTAEVPDSVAANIEQNLKSLLQIDSSMKLLFSPDRDPGADFVIPDSTPPQPEVRVLPIPENPAVDKALADLEKARSLVEKRRWESALSRLLQIQKRLARLTGDLPDASPIIDALELTAVAFMSGGFYDEGNAAIRSLLTVVPDYTGDAQSSRFQAAVDRNRDRVPVGGDLVINVTPADAVVYIDGKLIGQGSQAVSGLRKGRHYIRVTGDTSFPDGGTVNVKSAGDSVSVSYDLKSRLETIAPPPPPPVKAGPRPLVWYGKTGLFDRPEFSGDIRNAAAEVFADYVLFSFIARSDDLFHVGAFVGNGLNGSLLEVEKASIALDLSNLYVELLGLETRIQKAIQDPSTAVVVNAQPPIYRMVQARPEAVPAAVAVAAEPTPVNLYVEAPSSAAPPPAPAQTAPVVVDPSLPADFPMELPSDFPVVQTAPAPQQAWAEPETTVVEKTVVEEPIHKKWWLWTIVGLVVAGAVAGGVAGYIVGSDQPANVGGTVGF